MTHPNEVQLVTKNAEGDIEMTEIGSKLMRAASVLSMPHLQALNEQSIRQEQKLTRKDSNA